MFYWMFKKNLIYFTMKKLKNGNLLICLFLVKQFYFIKFLYIETIQKKNYKILT